MTQEQVIAERNRIISEMQRHYSGQRLQDIGEIAYRSSRTPPQDIVKAGGFLPATKQVRLATVTDSPNNEGLVDFSFVPEVATIFAVHKNPAKRYIYAAPVDKGYLMPGQWRQVSVPALPMPEFVIAREVTGNDMRKVTLGAPEIIGTIPEKFAKDPTLQRFLAAATLDIPQDIGLGDEHNPPHYVINDTTASKRFFPGR